MRRFKISCFVLLSAGNNEACETDADCSLTNQLCVGNDYYTTSTCIKGKCACTDAYVWDTDKCSK